MNRRTAIQVIAFALLITGLSGCADPLATLRGGAAPGLSGTLEYDRVELRSTSFEPVTAINANEGDAVAAGQVVLVQLDLDAQLAIARARAALEAAAARRAAAVRGPRQEQISAARATVAAATSRAAESALEAERQSKLFAQEVTSKQRRDQALARRDGDRADLEAANAKLAELQRGTTAEELDEAKAQVAQAQAQLDSELRRGGELEIRSSVAGTLDTLLVELGDRPVVGEAVAVVLTGPAYVRFYIPQQLRTQLQVGTSLRVQIDGIAEDLPASVRWVAREATFTPFYALNERDRKHLSYLAEAELTVERELPAGFPAQILIGDE